MASRFYPFFNVLVKYTIRNLFTKVKAKLTILMN